MSQENTMLEYPDSLKIYYKEIPTQLFSCEIWGFFKNPLFDRTPLVAASVFNEKEFQKNLQNSWENTCPGTSF